jgi:hypothetical protein
MLLSASGGALGGRAFYCSFHRVGYVARDRLPVSPLLLGRVARPLKSTGPGYPTRGQCYISGQVVNVGSNLLAIHNTGEVRHSQTMPCDNGELFAARRLGEVGNVDFLSVFTVHLTNLGE